MITKEQSKKLYDLTHEWNNQWRECLSESHRTGVYSGVGTNIDKAYNNLSNFIESITEPETTNRTQTIILGYNDLDARPPTKEEYEANIQAVEGSFEAAGLHIYIK